MRNLLCFFVLSLILVSCSNTALMQEVISKSFEVAEQQALSMAGYLNDKEGQLPRTYNKEEDKIITSGSGWWCSGFYPGVLWYLYENSEDENFRAMAEVYTARVEKEKFNTGNHDIGFQIYCSFGNGYRLTGRDDYREVLQTAGKSALTRFNSELGVIRSWNSNPEKWQYAVIIDNMMNLELLTWNYKDTGNETFRDVAVSHSDKTLKNHFRPDYSSYHVVSYDTLSGVPHVKQTHQGAFDESVWARGNAWGLYGYVVMYRETKLQRYLDQARGIANMMIDHPNMPDDGIPYWDYMASDIPDAYRDASAGAIMASALIELSTLTDGEESDKYIATAEKQLATLSTPEYLAEPGTNGFFILKRSVGHLPGNSEVDVPLSYADYYFVEALTRYKDLKGW